MRSEKKKTKMKNRQGKKKKKKKKPSLYTHSHSLSVGWHQLHSYHRPPSFFCVFLDLFINIYQLLKLLFLRLYSAPSLFSSSTSFRVWYNTTATKPLVFWELIQWAFHAVSNGSSFSSLSSLFFFLFFFSFAVLGSLPRQRFPVYNYLELPFTPTVLRYPIIELQQQSFLRMGVSKFPFMFDRLSLIDFLNAKSCIKK